MPRHVVIVGAGVAGLEALIAVRSLAGNGMALTLVSQEEFFVDRPVTVAEPFALGTATRFPLPDIAADLRARFVNATVEDVDDAGHRVRCTDETMLGFDTLILAPGARMRPPSADAIAFGLPGSGTAIKDMLGRLRGGEIGSVAFVAPSTTGWLLPLYELALMTAREVALSDQHNVALRLVTPEEAPLILFGESASESVARLLAAAGIEFNGGTRVMGPDEGLALPATGTAAPADCIVTLPLLSGPGLGGVPATRPNDFIPVDEHGRVTGLVDVYAAGDAVDFPIKQGGLAAQQADAVAAHVAAHHGAGVAPEPFQPVLRGMLLTGGEPRFLRAGVPGTASEISQARYPLWWPPTKIAGRYLAPYLARRSEAGGFGSPDGSFVDVDIALTASTLPG